MSKFKIGDRVVRINSNIYLGRITVSIGCGGVINYVRMTSANVTYDGQEIPVGSFLENIELEQVFNSPLYKALL